MSFDRTLLLTVAGSVVLLGAVTASRSVAADPAAPPPPAHGHAADTDHDGKGHEDEGEEHEGKSKDKETEQPVPMNMVPQPVIDAVMKECPGGKVAEAELEAKKGKIMWSFDVAVGDAKYDVKVTVEGKFFSKTVDDDADEKDGKDEKHDEKK